MIKLHSIGLLAATATLASCSTVMEYGAPLVVDVVADVLGVGKDEVASAEEAVDARNMQSGMTAYTVTLTDGRQFSCLVNGDAPSADTTSCEAA